MDYDYFLLAVENKERFRQHLELLSDCGEYVKAFREIRSDYFHTAMLLVDVREGPSSKRRTMLAALKKSDDLESSRLAYRAAELKLTKSLTMGGPLLLAVWNKDARLEETPELFCPRPGHADLAGALKWDASIRDVLERASARETAARVAAGALCRALLKEFGIEIRGHVTALGAAAVPDDFAPTWDELARADESNVRCLHEPTAEAMRKAVDTAKYTGDTLGGHFELVARGLPIGLGDCTQWDRKLDGRIAQALMSVQAINRQLQCPRCHIGPIGQ